MRCRRYCTYDANINSSNSKQWTRLSTDISISFLLLRASCIFATDFKIASGGIIWGECLHFAASYLTHKSLLMHQGTP